MMKKILAIILTLVICAGMSAMAAEWGEGLGPQKPYSGSPEVDFAETIGYMMFLPINKANIAPGANTLSIFLPREDVETASGTLKLFSKESKLVEEIAITPETMVARPMLDVELNAMMWGCGTAFEVKLAKPLERNNHYYVQMTEGCIKDINSDVVSPAITGKKSWVFDTEMDSYVDSITFYRTVEGKEEPVVVDTVQPGDIAKLSVILADDVAAAAVYCDFGVILPDVSYVDQTGEIIVRFPSTGEVKWGVIFVDEAGMGIYSADITTNVVEPAAE